MTRIYVDIALAVGDEVALPSPAVRHLVQVLRQRTGAAVTLFNGRGGEYLGVIRSQSRRDAVVAVQEYVGVERESPLALTLVQGISRGERMDYSIQKAVELGVSSIIPLEATRSHVQLTSDRAERRREHWYGIIVHACQQCGRNRLPNLQAIQTLDDVITAKSFTTGVVLNPEGEDSFDKLANGNRSIGLVIGPEGGLTEIELERLASAGYLNLRLGPRVLRTETAAVVGLSILQARCGDLSSGDAAL